MGTVLKSLFMKKYFNNSERKSKMDEIKGKIPMIIAIIAVVALLVILCYLFFVQKSDYYVQIDNTKIEQISRTDNMKYKYTITGYNQNGNSKEIEFNTSRELREGAYLKLEVMLLRGVITWEEVEPNELPDKVKTEMNVE